MIFGTLSLGDAAWYNDWVFDQDLPLLTQEAPGVFHFGGARMALLEIESGFWSIRRQIEALVGLRLANSVMQQAGANGGASFAAAFFSENGVERSMGFQTCLLAYQAAGFGKFEIESMDWPLGRAVIRASQAFEAWMTLAHGQRSEKPVCAYTAGVLVGFVNVTGGRQDVVCIEHSCQAQGAEFCEFELLPASQARSQDEVVAFNPDPGMSRQINLLETLFDRMPMGIAVIDRSLILRRFNPTWAAFIDQYTPLQSADVAPGVSVLDLEPGAEEVLLPLFERVFAGETVRQEAVRLESGGIISYRDFVLSPLYENGQVGGLLNVSIDATERVTGEQRLKESQRALTTLIGNLPGMAYRCQNDLNWTMEFVSEGSLDLTGYLPEDLIGNRTVSYAELIHPEDREAVDDAVQSALREDRRFQMTYRILTPTGEKWVWEQGQGIRDPEGKVIALEGFITDISERVMAHQNLEQRVDERTRELSTLLDISHNLASTLELEPLLDLILDQLGSVVQYDAASIMILEGDSLKILAYRGPITREEALQIRFTLPGARANYEVIRSRKPVIIPDVRGKGRLARSIREAAGEDMETTYNYLRCWMGVPLIVKDQVVGMLTLDHRSPGYYGDSQAELAMAFASQAAVAIENARLYRQVEQAAVTQERNRLARDLHDAVTQTLFSTSLIAEVLPKLWERNPEVGREKLEELRVLTRGALSEMRTLLLELRPDTLAEVELGDLYRHLTRAFTGRTRVPVALTQEGNSGPPPQVKEAFYRVGQEALNNIAKHAEASQVEVHLDLQEAVAEISIRDDGCGFDLSELSPENLGLKIMRERAGAIGASLQIQSAPGAGTEIRVCWEPPEEVS